MSPSPLRLLDAELRRFGARRAVRFVLAAGLLIATIVNVAQFVRAGVTTESRGGGIWPRSEIPEACILDDSGPTIKVDAQCMDAAQRNGFKEPPTPGSDTVEVEFLATVDRRPRIARTFEGTIAGIGAGFLFPALMLAATFLAAEFAVAGLSTLLTFEPRRWRVYLVKLLAAALGCAAILLLIIVWTGLGQYLISAQRGSTAGVDGAWIVDRLGDCARVALPTALAVAISFAVSIVTRRTVAAVGAFFGLFIAQSFLSAASWAEPIVRYNPINALFAIAVNDFTDTGDVRMTLGLAVTIGVVWAAALTAFGGWWFSRTELR